MKKYFLSLIAMMIAVAGFAQTSLLATLSHDGTISTFYGTTALKEAMAQADNGDAITLSAGQFLATNITKDIILRGAGMSTRNDSVQSHESTIVQGELTIELADSTSSERLNIEGIYFSSKITYKGSIRNALFMKNRFESITYDGGTMINSSFIHCRIASGLNLSTNSNASFVNCIFWNPNNKGTEASNFEFDNCVVSFNIDELEGSNFVINSYYKNCIIMVVTYNGSSYSNRCIPASNVAVNCVGFTGYGQTSESYNDIFYLLSSKNQTNKNAANKSLVFKTSSWNYNDYETFELTDEAKTTYLGTDGKQVGIYGGTLPYDENPTTPQITKCNVAAKSTSDGKLSVDIEVKAAEY